MNTSKIHAVLCVFLIAIMVLFGACKKFVSDVKPVDKFTTSEVFANAASAESALNGLYSQIVGSNYGFLNSPITIYPALSADETLASSAPNTFQTNSLSVQDYTVLDMWNNAYKLIYQCNSLVENLTGSTALAESKKNQLVAEAKFVRAFTYFYLVNLFGPVPLAVKTDYVENALLPRSDSATVYGQIIQDLTESKANLKAEYPTAEKVRVNKWAAASLLARVYLFQNNQVKAASESEEVIAQGGYQLEDPDNTFLPNNSAAILQFIPSSTQIFNTAEGWFFIPSYPGAKPAYYLTPQLLGAFEPGDLRRQQWVGNTTISGITYYYPYKYKVRFMPDNSKEEYSIVLRLAEQYLISAEALASQGQLAPAITALDAVRAKAGLPLIKDTRPAISKADLLTAIYHEKQIEFFVEWGHRWLDLKRTGRADQVLSALKPAWKTSARLYPIPYEELHLNPKLKQNSGYPDL